MAASAEVLKEEGTEDLAKLKWRSSGLTDEQAAELNMQQLDPDTTAGLGDNFYPATSLLIPYFDAKGKETDFFRVRYLGDLPGFAGMVEKPQRYAQPARTLPEVYMPPLLERPWEEIAKDAATPLYITEGELKAASGCAHGFTVLGLGGVDMWRATRRQIVLLPALAKFTWKNRIVVIVFDSDSAKNINVVRAQRALAQELTEHGGLLKIASLPPAKGGAKQGLDDFLVAEGAGALDKLLEESPPFAESDALWAMNEEIFYVKHPGVVVEIKDAKRIQPARFVNDVYANRHYLDTVYDKEGNAKCRKKPLARRWIDWESRFELREMTYAPGKPKIFDDTFNTWPGWGCEPKRGDITPWKWLLGFLFKSDPKQQEWFEQWCAYPIQHPGTKMFAASLIWGVAKGTGKSLAAYSLGGIYGDNFIEVKSKNLKTDFNSWAKDRQFIYGDEISGSEARIDGDWLKGLIVQPQVMINEKYLPVYTVPDQMNYYFSSNHPDAIFMEEGDRRYFVHEVVGGPASRDMYERYHKWLHGDGGPRSYEGKGASALFYYLLNLNLRNFNPRAEPPITAAKERMIHHGKSDVSLWVTQLRDNPEQALSPLLDKRKIAEADVFEVGALLRAYDPTERSKVSNVGMGRALYAGGFRQLNEGIPVRTKLGLRRLYVVRRQEKWEKVKPKEAVQHWEKYFAGDSIK